MEAPLKIGDTSAVVVMKARDMKFRDAAVTIGDKSIGVTVTLTEDNRSFDRLEWDLKTTVPKSSGRICTREGKPSW